MPIVWLSEHTGFFPGPVNIGLLRDGDRVITIDTGLDSGSARKLLRELEPSGLRPAGILLTHHHADHTGGAPRLVREGAAQVAASPVEAAVIRHPYWQPYAFCGGAHPPAVMRKKFLMPPAVNVTHEVQPGPWRPEGWGGPSDLEIVALPGHTPGQLGLRVGDILFSGDALLPQETWGKYGLAYFVDMGRSLLTCQELASYAPSLSTMVPGHGPAARGAEEILERVELNRRGIADLVDRVLQVLCSGADLTLEQVLEAVLARMGLTPLDIPEFFLNRASVQAALTYLSEQGSAEPHLQQAQLRWRPLPAE